MVSMHYECPFMAELRHPSSAYARLLWGNLPVMEGKFLILNNTGWTTFISLTDQTETHRGLSPGILLILDSVDRFIDHRVA